MAHPPPTDSEGPDDSSRDPLWALLDRSRKVPPAPDFSRRVMAVVQAEHTARQARWAWLHRLLAPSLRPALAMTAVALLLAGAWQFRSHPSQDRPNTTHSSPPATAPNDDSTEEIVQALASDLALLEDVDHLLDPEDGLDLDEEDVRRLLF